jgi:putative radical SAM enzyme (TIGR03279 family)
MIRVITSDNPKIPKGATLLAINRYNIEDFLEFNFYNDITKTRKVLIEINGFKKDVIFEPNEKISIRFQDPSYRQCTNDCVFCFINGLPSGLRKELYFRDDDYRLSFLFGNFLSLTNITKDDIKRIGRLKLSPLYVSVHTTDPIMRRKLFKNNRAGLIMKHLSSLVEENIKLHCQIVLIPGITDGESLYKTIYDLNRLYPGVSSIGVVPVGKTKYLKGIPLVSKALAKETISLVESLHNKFRKKFKKGLVYLADEFYIKTDYPIPDISYYDDFPQYGNGIGMARMFIDEMKTLNKINKMQGKILILTSKLAFPFLNMLKTKLNQSKENKIDVMKVENRFFGNSVTVSGLIGADDFSRTIFNLKKNYDRIVLPPNCVNDSGKFIDDKLFSDKRVIISPNSIRELLKCLQ